MRMLMETADPYEHIGVQRRPPLLQILQADHRLPIPVEQIDHRTRIRRREVLHDGNLQEFAAAIKTLNVARRGIEAGRGRAGLVERGGLEWGGTHEILVGHRVGVHERLKDFKRRRTARVHLGVTAEE
jgi:hypothetical protein